MLTTEDRDRLELLLDRLTKGLAAGIAVLVLSLVCVHSYRFATRDRGSVASVASRPSFERRCTGRCGMPIGARERPLPREGCEPGVARSFFHSGQRSSALRMSVRIPMASDPRSDGAEVHHLERGMLLSAAAASARR